MIKKNMLLLLLLVSAQVPVIMAETTSDETATVAVAAESLTQVPVDANAQLTIDTTTPAPAIETTSSTEKKPGFILPQMPTIDAAWKRTLQRSALLFVAHNGLKKTYTKFIFGKVDKNAFDNVGNKALRFLADYLYIVAKYMIDTRFEKTTDATANEIVEFIASEYTHAKDYDDNGTFKEKDYSFKKKATGVFFKALSRKQLWLPAELEITEFLKTPMARLVTTCGEKGSFNIEGAKFATIGIGSEKVANDLLFILAAKNQLPKFVVNLMATDRGFELVRDLLAKAFEDIANKIIADKILAEKAAAQAEATAA